MTSAAERPPLRVGMAQFKPRKGDVAGNLERVREWIAGEAGSTDLLVFPEACLSGYFVEGGVTEAALSSAKVAEGLGAPPGGPPRSTPGSPESPGSPSPESPGAPERAERPGDAPDVVIGFYEAWSGRLYNSVGYFTPDGDQYRVVHVHRKLFLPTYGVFDEARFVEPGRELRAFDTRLGRIGMLICEEMWHSISSTILALDGAELLVIASASPARDFGPGSGQPGNIDRWAALAPGAAQEHGLFVVVSQLVGSEGGKLFPGGSLAVAPGGEVVGRGPLLEEGITRVSLDGSAIRRARYDTPLLSDLEHMLPHLQRSLERTRAGGGDSDRDMSDPDAAPLAGGPGVPGVPGVTVAGVPRPDDVSILDLDLELVERTLIAFIRDEVIRHRDFERVVIGVSGGVDSAVSLTLAARALGPDNIYAFRLPYATSSQESLDHAALIVEHMGVHCRTIEITGSVDAYVEEHEPELSPLRRGNLAARFRSLTLFDQSAKLHALPLGTGNKSERLLGYYTWHADDSPPINPLGDLLKTQVWALARHLGVPDEIIDKPASADLVRGVHDEDELGISYHRADPILHWLLKGHSQDELAAAGFPEDEVELVSARLNATHWKRELPTVAVLSSTAIGEFYLRPVDY